MSNNAQEFDITCDHSYLNNSWYRFTGNHDSQMLRVGRVSMLKCGTVSPGWLTREHPTGTTI